MAGSATAQSGEAGRSATRGAFSASDSAARFYLPELDVLRFFAFLIIFVFHLTYDVVTECLDRHGVNLLADHHVISRIFWTGTSGVDLFFALSSYLITELLLRERAITGTVDVRSFYVRRMLRIWPLYFFFLGLAFVLSHYRTEFAVWRFYYFALLLLVGNFAFAGWGLPVSIGHLWSLCVEEQFYLLWPPVVRRVSRPGLVRVGLMMLGVSATARLALWMIGFPSGQAVTMNTFAHLDPIAAGILLATVPRNRLAGLRLASRAGLVALGFASWLLVSYYSMPVPHSRAVIVLFYPAVAFGCAAFLVAALDAGKSAGFMLNRQLIYLGKISYGLYIYHRLAISLTLQACARVHGEYDTEGLLMRAALSFASTVLLAAVSYRLLESPFLKLKRRFTHVPSRPV